MPVIKKSADLRNNYGEISAFCHKYREPVFITKNGEGDLAVMSIETYETLSGKNELYKFIQEGIDDIKNGKTLTEEEVVKNMEQALEK
jgi:PHD/YefM family antitoxin component YafN of YafNO toxin-antitoxin module